MSSLLQLQDGFATCFCIVKSSLLSQGGILTQQRYIEIKFSIDARSHTKNLNYRTKILRMVQDLAIFERTGLFSTNALAERWGCELVARAGDAL